MRYIHHCLGRTLVSQLLLHCYFIIYIDKRVTKLCTH